MLKRIVTLAILAMLVTLATLTGVYAEARGPKILGLQVGMPWEEAVKIARGYAEKKGLEVLANGEYDIIVGRRVYNGVNDSLEAQDEYFKILPRIESTNASPFLEEIQIFPRAFHTQNFDDEKIEIICARYDIPFKKMTPYLGPFGGWQYTNARDGYSIVIYCNAMEVNAIEKIPDMVLE